MHVTYLELYNEVGYDLLDDSRGGPGVPEPPRVAIMEDDQGGLHMRHVGMHRVTSEEETLHLVCFAGGVVWTGPFSLSGGPFSLCMLDVRCRDGLPCNMVMAHTPRQLFQGDARRAVSETVLNRVSSRSHAIFTMHIQAARVRF